MLPLGYPDQLETSTWLARVSVARVCRLGRGEAAWRRTHDFGTVASIRLPEVTDMRPRLSPWAIRPLKE